VRFIVVPFRLSRAARKNRTANQKNLLKNRILDLLNRVDVKRILTADQAA